jgi:flagellar motor switch protein FliN/FliY
MMSNSKDYLSPDEIEALLKTQDEETALEEALNVNDYLTSEDCDSLGQVNHISYGAAATTLSSLVAQKVEISSAQISVVKRAALSREFSSAHLAVSSQYSEGIYGVQSLLFTTDDAKIIADLLSGGSGVSDGDAVLTDAQTSTVQEAIQQMLASVSTSMSTLFNISVSSGAPSIGTVDFTNQIGAHLIPQDDVLVKVSFDLKIGSVKESKLIQFTTVPFVKNITTALKNAASANVAATTSNETPEVQQVLNQTEQAPSQSYGTAQLGGYSQPPVQTPNRNVNVSAQTPEWASFNAGSQLNPFEANNLNMLMHIPLKLSVELGRTQKLIKDILDLSQGSIVELDKLAGEPVDILVNDQLIAKGEVVVIDENFGVRVTEIITQWDRLQKLR